MSWFNQSGYSTTRYYPPSLLGEQATVRHVYTRRNRWKRDVAMLAIGFGAGYFYLLAHMYGLL
jgi:hypothetical protein